MPRADSAELLAQAHRGELTRGNATPGTPERRAVYRDAYLRRLKAAEERGYSRSQARGHPAKGQVGISRITYEFSDVPTTEGIADVTVTSSREARRVGQYLRDVRDLLEERIDEAAFRRKWRRRVRRAGHHELEPDPQLVIVMVFQAGPAPSERYRRVTAKAAS